ncbi:MAG: shikimate dehydrogenase [Pseudohongiellaceae bacterium]|jgi:shikimate dehydrogenase
MNKVIRVNKLRRETKVNIFGVVGHPIAHSKSPEIHGLFAQQCKVDIDYKKFDVAPDDFEAFIRDFFASGGLGLNITVPFKEDAFRLSTPANEKVKLSKAVNTLYLNDAGELTGDNTDGPGLVKDLLGNDIQLKEKRLLILGAGGAVRGILPSLIEQTPKSITIANRTIQKAEQLKKEFIHLLDLKVLNLEEVEGESYDVIINATSLGLQGKTPKISNAAINARTCCYDLMYSNQNTAFVSWCLENNAKKAIDGLGMLVEQAAVSFEIWLGAAPETGAVIDRMRVG